MLYGVYAMINKDERRDVSIRKPRPSIRKQLADSKQATSPKKAAAMWPLASGVFSFCLFLRI